MTPDVLILIATQPEASFFLERSCLEQQKTSLRTRLFLGNIGEKKIHLLITGPGVLNAAMALTAYLEHHRPAMILNAGIAGGFAQAGINLLDIAVATRVQYLHTGIQIGSFPDQPLPFELISGFPQTREGAYPVDTQLADTAYRKLKKSWVENNSKVVKGPLITVSSITGSLEQSQLLYDSFEPLMEAMEGAGFAHAACCHGIPFVEIRAASNIAGERDKSKWDINGACRQIAHVLTHLLADE